MLLPRRDGIYYYIYNIKASINCPDNNIRKFIEKNEIGFALGNVIKYLLRDKDDRVQDLLKAKHYIDLHLALTYNVDPDGNKLDET